MYNYAVLGAGRQGTAAAYDMARWGDARSVLIADIDFNNALKAARRVNSLVGTSIATAVQLDVTDSAALAGALSGVDAFLSATTYHDNLAITETAVEIGSHMCDLGGHTGIARQQHQFDASAKEAGVSIIPNCGQVPGMGTSLMVYAISLVDEPIDVFMWDGGLPQNPKPPFDYLLTFHIAGLTNEYAEPATFIRAGEIVTLEPMTELETVTFPDPIGTLEAFVTGGGTDTMPWTFEGKLRTLQNKTLRYPGHFAQLRAFYDLGLWELDPVPVAGVEIVPRDLFHTLFEPKVTWPNEKDLIVLRVKVVGQSQGARVEATVDLIDHFDESTGFTAMERTTGWSAAIVAEMMARGQTPHGAAGVETQVPAQIYVDELRRRGLNIDESIVHC